MLAQDVLPPILRGAKQKIKQNECVRRTLGLVFAASLLALAPWAARAQEAEAAYASFHRAALAADLEGMFRLVTPAMRARMTIDRNLDEQARKLAAIMPTSYSVSGRASGASRVVLELDGSGSALAAMGSSGKLKGKARLLREGAEWKIDYVEWMPVAAKPPPSYRAEPVRPGGSPVPMVATPSRPRRSMARAGQAFRCECDLCARTVS